MFFISNIVINITPFEEETTATETIMASHKKNNVEGPAPYAMNPPSVKLARKKAIDEARQVQVLEPLPPNIARQLFLNDVNRRLEL